MPNLDRLCPRSTSDEVIVAVFAAVALMTLVLSLRLATTLFRRNHPLNARVAWTGRLAGSVMGVTLGAGWLVFAVYVFSHCP